MNIFNEAIEMHALWKTIFKKHMEEGVLQDINKVGDCHACDLGRWIYKEGVRYNHLFSFESMCIAHEHFHRTAAEVIYHINNNNISKARSLLAIDGAFSQSSSKLIRALMDCSKDLTDSVVKGLTNKHKVKDILQHKEDKNIISINGDASAMDAIKMMVNHNVGSIAITRNGKFLGIFTERSYMQHIVYKGECCLKTPVSEMIDIGVMYVNPDDFVEQCLLLMTTSHIRHLPVVDHEGKLVGMISIGDVIKEIVSDDGDTISQLENYVHNTYGSQ